MQFTTTYADSMEVDSLTRCCGGSWKEHNVEESVINYYPKPLNT
jgi:hypothetical protein